MAFKVFFVYISVQCFPVKIKTLVTLAVIQTCLNDSIEPKIEFEYVGKMSEKVFWL